MMDNSAVITISTHNVNGIKRGKDFLTTKCESNPNSIMAIQEHWLRPPYKKQYGVNQLRCLHSNFDGYGTSAMTKAVETKVVNGRLLAEPVFNKKYSKCNIFTTESL